MQNMIKKCGISATGTWGISAILAFSCLLLLTSPCRAANFTVNGNGTVTDNVTRLMWQQEDDEVLRNWDAAIDYCETLALAGYEDWRLPNIRELQSITDDSRYDPAIDSVAFPGTNSTLYRSSSTSASMAENSWSVNFSNGNVSSNFKTNNYFVRCVRGGK